MTKILEELGLEDDRSNDAPTPFNDSAPEQPDDSKPYDQTSFSSVLGMLQYLNNSRPDLMYATSMLSSRASQPTMRDWRAMIRVGRYLIGTRDLGVHLRKGDGGLWAHAYVDASFAGHPDGRSHSGMSVHLVPHSGPVYVSSKKQSLVALSSTESETDALKNFCTLADWLKPLLAELGYSGPSYIEQEDDENEERDSGDDGKPIHVFEDNMATIHLAKQDGNWGRTKLFLVRY